MEHPTDRLHKGVLRSLDWWTILIYLALLTFGWVSVCGASYSYGETDIFSLDTRSGMQIVWIATSIVLGFVLLMTDDRYYEMLAFIIFGILLVLLFGTIFNPHTIKGSRSWLVLGPLRLQPAEFAKFATALALAKLMSIYGYDIHKWKHFAAALVIIFLPMIFIVLQHETGSALVYVSFFLMLYREGMPGSVLLTGVAMVVYFVVGIRFADVMMWYTPISVGRFSVLLMIMLFSSTMVWVYCKDRQRAFQLLAGSVGSSLLLLLFSLFVIPFDITKVMMVICGLLMGYLVWLWLSTRLRNYAWIAVFALGSLVFYSAADYVLNNMMQPHQRVRINVLLGLEEDLKGAGYNVHQSEIAIGSGGLEGKGFLNGTQTKLKFVPEQDTDFIFCTVGEEEGFVGSAGVLLLFLALILRLIRLAERQPHAFGRIYGYCVLSIFLFHVFINVGMVLGLTPVIGIPLPFFSYGGSSLWGFTLLLFIFLRIDAGRNLVRK
jgi:rod shape determining protein RodA